MTTEASKKIAAITDDGKTISQHFGRAAYYLVATLKTGQIVARCATNSGINLAVEPHREEEHGQPHGMDALRTTSTCRWQRRLRL